MFSPGIWWSGLRVNRFWSDVHALQMASLGCEAPEGLQASAEVVGIDEVGQVASELVVRRMVEAFNGGVLGRPVHALDLAVGPRVPWLGQAVVDAVLRAGIFQGVRGEVLALVHGTPDVGG